MAIRLIDRYPSRANPATTQYPHGSGRNKSDPTADDGTPFDQDRFNDQEAFFQGLLTYAGITPSGTVDTVPQSDYLNAFNALAGARQVGSVSALQSGSYPASLDRIWLSGYYGVGTAGGGPLYRDADDTTTADNGGTVFVDADGVRWKRNVEGYYYATWWGLSENEANNSPHLQKAIDEMPENGGTLFIPRGLYNFDDPIIFPRPVGGETVKRVNLEGDAPVKNPGVPGAWNESSTTLRYNNETSTTPFLYFGSDDTDKRTRFTGSIRNLSIHGTTNQQAPAISFYRATDACFDYLSIKDFGISGYGVDIHDFAYYSTFYAVNILNCRSGIYFRAETNGLQIINCLFSDNGIAGVDSDNISAGIHLNGCYFENNVTGCVLFNCFLASVLNCYFEANTDKSMALSSGADRGSSISVRNTYFRQTHDNGQSAGNEVISNAGTRGNVSITDCIVNNADGTVFPENFFLQEEGFHCLHFTNNATTDPANGASINLIDLSAVGDGTGSLTEGLLIHGNDMSYVIGSTTYNKSDLVTQNLVQV